MVAWTRAETAVGQQRDEFERYRIDIVGSVPDHCNKASIPIK